jgi:ferredoxin-thioredoxin reductase catalytic subunit
MSGGGEEARALERLKTEARQTGYILNPDEDLVMGFAAGLLKNEARYGYRSCPCRLATGDYGRDCDIICPCAYRDWDLDRYGYCYCGLYVTKDFIRSGAEIEPIPDSRPTLPTKPIRAKEGKEVPGLPSKSGINEVVKVFSYTLGREGRG